MAKETTGNHTAASLNLLAGELEDWAKRIRGAAAAMGVSPEIKVLPIRYESSRSVGWEYVRSWVNAAHQTTLHARLEMEMSDSPVQPTVQQEPPKKRIRRPDTNTI